MRVSQPLAILFGALLGVPAVLGQDAPKPPAVPTAPVPDKQTPPAPKPPDGAAAPAKNSKADSEKALAELRTQAADVRPLVESDLARAFLSSADQLPVMAPRLIFIDPQTREAFKPGDTETLPEPRRSQLKKRIYDTRFYYTTGYGSPMLYARPLDVLASHGVDSLRGKKVLDFGYGMIGQDRMMALLGADVHGVDVEPVLAILYCQPGDTGEIAARDGTKGKLTVHNGQWPAYETIRRDIGGDYDIILSKNTLKAGYIHPARETDPARLVHLGVSDAEFLKGALDALKPGGLFLVYNISPAQAPPDKPYVPWADGQFPFERSLVEKTGFEVLAWDKEDDDKNRAMFAALDPGKTPDSFKDNLFTHYTLLRRPAASGAAGSPDAKHDQAPDAGKPPEPKPAHTSPPK